jgi:hypothetical protein
MAIDPATQRMCDETGHACEMCSSDVRNLAAIAHNMSWRLRVALDGEPGHWPKVRLYLEDLDRALATLKPETEAHFAALDAWRRP